MELSPITKDLFIGTTPALQDYPRLRDLGVRLVINMRFEHHPRPDNLFPPLTFLWLRTIDSPLFPIPIRALMRGTQAALETIYNGGKVYAHCAGGRHRGVAMGASILIAQGYAAEEAMKLIKVRRSLADPHVFYIQGRILRFARAWQTIE
jgi:protein-tyrosine phosphatase